MQEQCDGVLLDSPRGDNGFGDDPIFYVPDIGKTTAGVIFLLISLLSCFIFAPVVHVVSIIQGVLYFTTTQEEFERKWVYAPTNIPLF